MTETVLAPVGVPSDWVAEVVGPETITLHAVVGAAANRTFTVRRPLTQLKSRLSATTAGVVAVGQSRIIPGETVRTVPVTFQSLM